MLIFLCFLHGLLTSFTKASTCTKSYLSNTGFHYFLFLSIKSLTVTSLNWSLNERHELSWSTSDGSTSDGSAMLVPVHALRNILVVFTSVLLNKYLY